MRANKTQAGFAIALAALLLLSGVVFAQRRGFGGRFVPYSIPPNAKYDGRFAFVRVKYETAPGGYWWRGLPSWAHGYPTAESNLIQIMNHVSYLNAHEQIDTI